MAHARSFPGRVVRIALVAGLAAGIPSPRAQQPPLIPRALIFESSERGNPALSPDGRMVAYSALHGDVESIWVKTIGQDDDRVVTNDTQDGILYCYWQPDGEHILTFQDRNGDENSHLIQTDIRTGLCKDLTPLLNARATSLIMEAAHPDTILVHINARDERLFDLYRIDLRTGSLQLDTENPGDVARFEADHHLRVRAAYVTRPDNSVEIRVRDDIRDPWRTLIAWGGDEMNSDNTGIAGFNADDTGIRVITSLGANTERLLEVNLRTGEKKILGEDPRFDVTGLLTHPTRNTLEAVGFEKERMVWAFLDEGVRADFESLGKVRHGDISIRGRDVSDAIWLVGFSAPDSPTTYYRYDRVAKQAALLFSEDPKLESVSLAKKQPVQFRSQDGMLIYGYLTLPTGLPPRGLPLVVQVHGGPWTRDSWRLDFPVQCLANRGYAVLQVNFRGSTGYGKDYQSAGDLEWGGKVIQDLVDGKDWAVAQGLADPERVAIVGSSFGGYAALAALAFRPREFACGVAINAISDPNRFLAAMPPYWTVAKARFETRMGKDPRFLESISPLGRADQVVRPLLIMHNANDVRVKQEQADLMVAALRGNGRDVAYLVFPNAGHMGGGVPLNVRRRWAAIEAFLAENLGGRAEPPGEGEDWADLEQ